MSSVIQVFTKSAKSGDLTFGLLPSCKFSSSSSISQIYTLDQQLLVFFHIYKSSKIYGNMEGKLGNRHITEKNDDGGGGGWCVICSELSTKSTPVIDTRVLGRHGMMMSGSSGASWVSEVLQNLPNCRFTCQRGPLGCMAQIKGRKKGGGAGGVQLKFEAIFEIYVIHRFEVQQKLVIFCCYMGLL